MQGAKRASARSLARKSSVLRGLDLRGRRGCGSSLRRGRGCTLVADNDRQLRTRQTRDREVTGIGDDELDRVRTRRQPLDRHGIVRRVNNAVLRRNRGPCYHLIGAIDDEVSVQIGFRFGLRGGDNGQARRLPYNLHVRTGDLLAVLWRGNANRVRILDDRKADRWSIQSGDRDMTRVGDDQLNGVFAGWQVGEYRRVGRGVQDAALLWNWRPLNGFIRTIDDEVRVIVRFVLCLRGGNHPQAGRLPGHADVSPSDFRVWS